MTALGYNALIEHHRGAHLTLTIDTKEPIELDYFVGAFTSIANEFERFVQEEYSGAKAEDTRMFIREVRHGSFEADIITGISTLVAFGVTQTPVVASQIMVMEDFIRRWGGRITTLIKGQFSSKELDNTAQLEDYYKTVRAIACDPQATHKLESAVFEGGKRKVRSSFKFTSIEARTAEQNILNRRDKLKEIHLDTYSHVLMTYTRTDIHDAKINKRSSERVVIESISPKGVAVIYASENIEQEMRQHIRYNDENVYKKGFVVDIAVQKSAGKTVAYSVLALHSIIDIE